MSITRYHTNKRMSKIVVHGNQVFLCGQVTSDASLGIEDQTENTLSKISDLLAEVNSDKEHLLSATIYLSDMKNFKAMNEVWERWLPANLAPVRACVQANLARPELLIEISVIAVATDSPKKLGLKIEKINCN